MGFALRIACLGVGQAIEMSNHPIDQITTVHLEWRYDGTTLGIRHTCNGGQS